MYSNAAQMGSASRPAVAVQEYANQQAMGNKAYSMADAVKDTLVAPKKSQSVARAPAPAPKKGSAGTGRSSSGSGGYSSGGGGGRSSGGGGGPSAASKQLQASTQGQMNALLALMQSPLYKFAPNDALRGRVNTAVDTDLANSNSANDELVRRLQTIQATNPYGNLHAQGSQAAPQANALLASQGVNDQSYQQLLQQLNGQSSTMANNWNNLYAAQGANYGYDVNSQNAQAAMARQQSGQEISAQRNALLAMVDQQDLQKKTAMDQQKAALAQQLIQLLGTANTSLPSTLQIAQPTAEQMGLV